MMALFEAVAKFKNRRFWAFYRSNFATVFLSFFIVAFGQTDWIPGLGILAACCGYALFWSSLLYLSTMKERVFRSFFWFLGVQLVQLSWLATVDYMGPWIFLAYFFITFLLALQFGLLSAVLNPRSVYFSDCLLMAGGWVLLEWSRLFVFSGFMWNPVALSLADSNKAIQFASLFGVYGLSFWVIFVNAFGVYLMRIFRNNPALSRAKTLKIDDRKRHCTGTIEYRLRSSMGLQFSRWLNAALFLWIGMISVCRRNLLYLGAVSWSFLAAFPYLFGFLQEEWVLKKVPIERMYAVALVQTGILPEQKDVFFDRKEAFISPLGQWERIWSSLDVNTACDLMVLPEASVCLGAYRAGYSLEALKASWCYFFGEESLRFLPPLEFPLARKTVRNGRVFWRVTNAFIAQSLANYLNADIIAGFDDEEDSKKYNAVFHFRAGNGSQERYEKRVLVPIGEYVPFTGVEWFSQFLAKEFGIGDSFNAGEGPKLFSGELPIGVSVCVEETYSHLIRHLRLLGARLFVNVTNDVWFPRSRLPFMHFHHGRIRSAENGVYSLRSCNTGVTGVIDCFGKAVETAAVCEQGVRVLYHQFPVRSFQTLYSMWGDGAILGLSCLFVVFGLYRRFSKSPEDARREWPFEP